MAAVDCGGSCVAQPPHRAAQQPCVTIENFKNYIDFRILDSIAYPGTYKKFMIARKEQGVEWAIDMAQHVQAVQNAIHELEQKEQQLRTSQLSALHIVWVHVAESNLPPSDLQLTIANCVISRKTSVPCVVIKGKGRGAQPFTVNSRFCSFLHDIWIVYKIDILIKTFARGCMDEIDPTSQLPMAVVVEAFKVGEECFGVYFGLLKWGTQDKRAEIEHLAAAFHAAYLHVYRSAASGLQTLV